MKKKDASAYLRKSVSTLYLGEKQKNTKHWLGDWLCLGFVSSVQVNSVAQSCPTLRDPMNRSTPGLPVHHQLPEFTQAQVHPVGDADFFLSALLQINFDFI
ncbi:unnamed protein product [Rangifer tarandus platyrhynchus]|uniref:Uncharacterized protein n=1 Tax=Rangifer tarandus platyrhynchus TaxID=3082113 RepID=A0AC59YEH8_RANTA